jgi:hypothetical protein
MSHWSTELGKADTGLFVTALVWQRYYTRNQSLLMEVEPHKQCMANRPHTTPEHTDNSQHDTCQPLKELAQHVDESDPTTINAHPDFDTLDDYNPDTPLTGRVAAWFTQEAHGGVLFGGLCLPGTYSVVPCPDNQHPDALLGTEHTATPVGWYHAPPHLDNQHDLPDTPGTYLLITPHHDQCH